MSSTRWHATMSASGYIGWRARNFRYSCSASADSSGLNPSLPRCRRASSGCSTTQGGRPNMRLACRRSLNLYCCHDDLPFPLPNPTAAKFMRKAPDGCSTVQCEHRLRENLLNVDDASVEVGRRLLPMQLEPACGSVDELKAPSMLVTLNFSPNLRSVSRIDR